jgi:hypothetical protein
VDDDPALARYNVMTGSLTSEPGIEHRMAAPFEAFFNATGPVLVDGQLVEGVYAGLYATGYPITEPYWARVSVDGSARDVLIQCFERRCLTYTPDNPDGWRVEMGNVGRHYHAWRYGD